MRLTPDLPYKKSEKITQKNSLQDWLHWYEYDLKNMNNLGFDH